MKKRLVVLISAVLLAVVALAADLPEQGKSPPTPPTTRGPGGYPGDPGTPIGGGLFILLGLSSAYVLIKKRNKK